MPDWSQVELPLSWVDELDPWRPADFLRLAKRLFGKRRAVELPASLQGADRVPDYVLKEFHHLPNGFFSRRSSANYAKWFDITMLGRMGDARREIVNALGGRRSVLDLGCGGGDLAAACLANGTPDVVGLDVSPYMLQQASLRHPGLRLVHAAAEDSGFPTSRFDAVAACFIFHELPSPAQESALNEVRRILTPRGRLVICEPAPQQMRLGWWEIARQFGVRGWWWKALARVVHEPHVADWHRRDVPAWLESRGFRLLRDWVDLPFRTVIADLR